MKFADLHLHTNFSDGTYSPKELVLQSKRAGLSAISVVDHDTIDGVGPVIEIAKEEGLEVLPGIELSAEHLGVEIHILGYLIDCQNRPLLEKVSFLKENRIKRAYDMLDKLKALGVELKPESIFNAENEGTVGRMHVARALLKEGKVKTIAEAFQKYIGDKGPAYCLGFKFSVLEAIKLIREASGIPVLAHPYVIQDDAFILEFIDYGIMGLEVYYPEHSQSMTNFYLDLAKKHNLSVTGGSDCHGKAKPEVKIGSVKIPYELVEQLKDAKKRL